MSSMALSSETVNPSAGSVGIVTACTADHAASRSRRHGLRASASVSATPNWTALSRQSAATT